MYDNSTKATWRGWAWNQLCDRLGKSYSYRPKRVCVLAGTMAGDMPHAIRHNVQCIAVDFDSKCVETFRKNGGVAVRDSLRNQMLSIQPDGLIADMLCGVGPSGISMLTDSVGVCDAVVFNFLRGRDKGISECSGLIPSFDGRHFADEPIGKHRGKIALIIASKIISELWFGKAKEDPSIPKEVFNLMRPSFYSYRSKDSGQYFDSVAITTKDFRIHGTELVRIRQIAPLASRRKSAAAKAVLARTGKLILPA